MKTTRVTAAKSPFRDEDVSLSVLEAMVRQDLVKTNLRIPGREPLEGDDVDDESQSWRDRVGTNQDDSIRALIQLLIEHRTKIPLVTEVDCTIVEIADVRASEPYEVNLTSLEGIEACTGLEKLGIWSRQPSLDLSPLVSLPALRDLDLTCARSVKNLKPILEMKSLKRVRGAVDAQMAAALKTRGVRVTSK